MGRNKKFAVGDRVGSLTLFEYVGHDSMRRPLGLWRCDCGATVTRRNQSVLGGSRIIGCTCPWTPGQIGLRTGEAVRNGAPPADPYAPKREPRPPDPPHVCPAPAPPPKPEPVPIVVEFRDTFNNAGR